MTNLLRQLQIRVDALALWERILVFLAGTAVLFMLWNQLMFNPQNAERQALTLQMQTVQQKLDFLTQEATLLAQLVGGGTTDQGKIQQLARLAKQNSTLNSALSDLTVGLVPADDLLNILKNVLQQSNKLNIKRIESLPPQELRLTSVKRTGGLEETGVLNHAVVLTLEGSYFELLQYLQGLEQLPWRFYWDSLNYRVSGYPDGDIELKVSTLTMKEALFEDQ
jgi:MSHA biogenesis protein MshJ